MGKLKYDEFKKYEVDPESIGFIKNMQRRKL